MGNHRPFLRTLARVTRRRDLLLACLLGILALTWSAFAAVRVTQVSLQDEWTYIDYAYKAAHFHIPAPGEQIGAFTQHEWDCRGTGQAPNISAGCPDGRATTHLELPFEGENYNTFHPPLLLAAAGFTGRLWAALGGSFVVGARFFSGIVAAAGVILIYYALRRFRLSTPACFGGALTVLATPAIANAAAIVHTDSINILAGALALWFLGRVTRGNSGWVAPALATLAITYCRVQAVVPMLAVAAMLACAALRPRLFPVGGDIGGGNEAANGGGAGSDNAPGAGGTRAETGRSTAVRATGIRGAYWRIVAGQIGAVLLGYGSWSQIQAWRAPAGYVASIQGVSTNPLADHGAWGVLRTFIDIPLNGPYGLTQPGADYHMAPQMLWVGTNVWGWMLFAVYMAVFLGCVMAVIRTVATRISTGTVLAGLVLTTAVVQGREVLLHHMYFRRISGRYAVVTAPQHALVLAAWLDHHGWAWTLPVFGAIGYVLVFLGPLVG
mgnify:CR=1 FL=1